MSDANHGVNPNPRPAFYLAVVGDQSFPAQAVVPAFERLTRGVRNRCRFAVLTPGGGPVVDWCRATNTSTFLVPYLPELHGRFAAARLAVKLAANAHGLLIFGDPAGWPALVRTAALVGLPRRVVRCPPS